MSLSFRLGSANKKLKPSFISSCNCGAALSMLNILVVSECMAMSSWPETFSSCSLFYSLLSFEFGYSILISNLNLINEENVNQ